MREHFQQSEHFTDIPPHVDLSRLDVSTNHGRNTRPGTDLPYRALSPFSHLQNGFASLSLSFPSVKPGKVAPAHVKSLRMNCDKVPLRPVVGACKWDNKDKKAEKITGKDYHGRWECSETTNKIAHGGVF